MQQYPPQQPSYPPPPPPQQPWTRPLAPQQRVKPPFYRRPGCLIGLAIVALLLIYSVVQAAIDDETGKKNAALPTPAATVAHQAPTATPTTKPTPSDIFTSALIGADISYFQGTYGKATSQPTDFEYVFKGHLVVNVAGSSEPSPYTSRVTSLLQNQDAGQFWTPDEATQKCAVFLPKDAQFQEQHELRAQDGSLVSIKKVYQSASLAKQLPDKAFRSFQTPEPAGTFGVDFNYTGSDQQVTGCAVDVNLNM